MIILRTYEEAQEFLDNFDGQGMIATDSDLVLKSLETDFDLVDTTPDDTRLYLYQLSMGVGDGDEQSHFAFVSPLKFDLAKKLLELHAKGITDNQKLIAALMHTSSGCEVVYQNHVHVDVAIELGN